MKKSDLIEQLQKIEGDLEVKIFDFEKNFHDYHKSGDTSNHGIEPNFHVDLVDFSEGEYTPWIALSFVNDDYKDSTNMNKTEASMSDLRKKLEIIAINEWKKLESKNRPILTFEDKVNVAVNSALKAIDTIYYSECEWVPVNEGLPDIGVEVIGYSEAWVHPDFNPDGMRICFMNGEGDWFSAKWNNDQDSWDTHSIWSYEESGGTYFTPTYWRYKPTAPINRTE